MNIFTRIILTTVLYLLGFNALVYAQSKRVDKLIATQNYIDAIKILSVKARKNPPLLLQLADCQQKTRQYEEAETTLRKYFDVEKLPTSASYLQYAQVLLVNKKYTEAKEQLEKYQLKNPNDNKSSRLLKACDDVNVWYNLPQKYVVKNQLDMNSPFSDFCAVEYKDDVVFVTERNEDIVGGNTFAWTKNPYTSIVVAKAKKRKDSTIYKPNGIFSNKLVGEYNTGPVAFNKDYTEVYFNKVQNLTSKRNKLVTAKIYSATYENGTWKNEKSFAINNDYYSILHPTLSKDGKRIYFASDMAGGFGGYDIYYCDRISADAWSKPKNLGAEVNTAFNEVFPHVVANGMLYFSSNGLGGYGGLDVFSTAQLLGKWTTPINQKAPLNSSNDDFGLTFKRDNVTGYFASNRNSGNGSDDIYSFTINKEIINVSGALVENKDTTKRLPNVDVALIDNKGKIIQVAKTKDDGSFLFENVNSDNYSVIKIDKNQEILRFKKQLSIVNDSNQIVSTTNLGKDGFEFNYIKTDKTIYTDIDEGDNTALISKSFEGFLYRGSDSTQSVDGVLVSLLNAKKELVQSHITQPQGKFVLKNMRNVSAYIFTVDSSKSIAQETVLLVKNKAGEVVYRIVRNVEGFTFRMIATDKTFYGMLADEDDSQLKVNVKGKLKSGDGDNSPIPYATVRMMNDKQEVVQTTKTDSLGNFKFNKLAVDKNYYLSTNEDDPALVRIKKAVIQNESGKELYSATKGDNGKFKFNMLAYDKTRYTMLEEVDETQLRVKVKGQLKSDAGEVIPNAKVVLKEKETGETQTAFTDADGRFTFNKLSTDKNYYTTLDENDPALKTYNKVVLYNDKGVEQYRAEKAEFKFNFIPTDKTLYTDIEEIDTQLKPITKQIEGKIKTDDGTALAEGTIVYLKDEKGNVVATGKLDKYGNFKFDKIPTDKSYYVDVDADDTQIRLHKGLVMTDKLGNETRKGFYNASGKFVFHLIKGDKSYYSDIEEEDNVALKIVKKTSPPVEKVVEPIVQKTEDPIIVIETKYNTENVYFDFGSSYLTTEIKAELKRIAQHLKESDAKRIQVAAHADARGNYNYNKWLTDCRMNKVIAYLATQGIDKRKLKGKSLGETDLVNKCANKVKCTEAEHKENRRTAITRVK
jgi:peptidoglycan-associated lipoprotein